MLGLYVSDHPLQGLEHVLAAERDIGIGELVTEDGPRDGVVTIAGMITSVTRKTTKRGDIWAVLTVEDLEASVERSEEHTSELQSRQYLVCRLLLEKKKKTK